jgi:flagellar hook-length control protein FliK
MSPQATVAEIVDGPVAVGQIAPEQGSAAAAAGTVAPAAFSSVSAFTGATQLATNSTAPVAPSGAPAQFSLPVPVHQQVFTAVSPLLRAADGSYGVRLQLHPQDLGAVQVIVDVRHGEISIQMHSTDAAARDALRGGLSDLRQQLEGQGLSAGSMEVGSGGAHARQPETPWSRPATAERRGGGDQSPDRNVTAPAAASSTSLDLRM